VANEGFCDVSGIERWPVTTTDCPGFALERDSDSDTCSPTGGEEVVVVGAASSLAKKMSVCNATTTEELATFGTRKQAV
jgi:DNA-binding helix-hairpin-helix protein with protein kinase domain